MIGVFSSFSRVWYVSSTGAPICSLNRTNFSLHSYTCNSPSYFRNIYTSFISLKCQTYDLPDPPLSTIVLHPMNFYLTTSLTTIILNQILNGLLIFQLCVTHSSSKFLILTHFTPQSNIHITVILLNSDLR